MAVANRSRSSSARLRLVISVKSEKAYWNEADSSKIVVALTMVKTSLPFLWRRVIS